MSVVNPQSYIVSIGNKLLEEQKTANASWFIIVPKADPIWAI